MHATTFSVHFVEHTAASLPGKLADAELWFTGGPLDGLRLQGFAIWTRRDAHPFTAGTDGTCTRCDASQHARQHTPYNVTFPARQYSVNGERRSFALLRPTNADSPATAQERIADAIITAWLEHLNPTPAPVTETTPDARCPKCANEADDIGDDATVRRIYWCASCGTEFMEGTSAEPTTSPAPPAAARILAPTLF